VDFRGLESESRFRSHSLLGGITFNFGAPPPPPPPPQAPVRVGGAIQPPKELVKTDPVYPPIAKQAKVEGQVILEATIGRDGNVKDVRVLRGNALFNDAAMDAVKKWKYTPTMLNNQPVEVLMTVVVNFVLK